MGGINMRLNEIEIQENGLTKAEERQVDEWIAANPDSPLIAWADEAADWFKDLGKAANLESR